VLLAKLVVVLLVELAMQAVELVAKLVVVLQVELAMQAVELVVGRSNSIVG
jgi:hypothetical protein